MNTKKEMQKLFEKWNDKTNYICKQDDEKEHPFTEYWCCEKHQGPEAAFKAGFEAGIKFYCKVINLEQKG